MFVEMNKVGFMAFCGQCMTAGYRARGLTDGGMLVRYTCGRVDLVEQHKPVEPIVACAKAPDPRDGSPIPPKARPYKRQRSSKSFFARLFGG